MKKHLKPLERIQDILTSHVVLLIYLLVLFVIFLYPSLDNFFVADDFSWLRWAHESSNTTLLLNFIDAQGFFFRPIPKLLIYLEYNLFQFNQLPYHIVNLLFNYGASIAAYILLFILFKKKTIAFLGVILFSFIPSHSQDLYWLATISTTVSSLFVLFGLVLYYLARTKQSILLCVAALFLFLLSVFTYENVVIFIGLMVLVDIFLVERKKIKKLSVKAYPYLVALGIILLYLFLRLNAHAAGFSGDYDYNVGKAIPNSIGNYLGYVAMFFLGENSLAAYNFVRDNLRAYALLLSVIGCFFIAFVAGFTLEHKEKIRLGNRTKLFIFGFLFSIVSLLPYLPLGNITLRYLYLASFGFIVMILCILDGLVLGKIKEKRYNQYAYIVLTVLVGVACYIGLQIGEKYWARTSEITLNTVEKLGSYQFPRSSYLYFYNIPTKIGEAYIFPVGLPDAVYSVHKDPTLRIFIINDEVTARKLSKEAQDMNTKTFIFTFDNQNIMHEVQQND